jgi:RTX calcium-binding nonapeptide repeat (4 copies)/WD40-like Beta Propeller Repeat
VRAAAIALLIGTVSAGAALARPASPHELPDFSYSVYARNLVEGAALCVARNGDAQSGRRLAGLGYYQGASWSPDGSRFAVALERRSAGRGIRVLPASGGAFQALTRPRATEVDSEPNWSPDGTRIAFSRYVFYGPGHDYRRFGLWVVDTGTQAERHFSNALPASGDWSPTDWSPSGDRLAVRFTDGLSLFTADGRLLWTISRGQRIGDVAWAPTGDVIAADFDREVLLVARDGSVVQTIVRPEIGDAELQALESGLSWSPDARRLAVGGGIVFDRDARIVERYAPPSTRKLVSFDPRWSPNGTAIVFDQAAAVYIGSRYGQVLTRGAADLYAFAVGSGETSRLTATANVNESDVRFRPAPAAGTASKETPCMREGTAGRDVIHGTGVDDLVDAGPGDDVVDGRGGDDVIVGGAGADLLVGGPGRDGLWGERGNDRFRTRDTSRDTLHGGPGRDRAWIDRRDSVFGVELVSPRSAHR